MIASLVVWADGIRAAEIHAAQGSGFTLRYTDDWHAHPSAYPFSPHLPLNHGSGGAEVKNFFENLLPEGSALDVAASMHNLSKHDAFGLLAKIGREAAGALCLMPEGEAYETEPLLRPLAADEVSRRIRERPGIPFTAWDRKFRLSIAGYQDKLAIYVNDNMQVFLPNGGASSTHIIKPENSNPQLPFMPANEHFCMRLAAQLKLPVPHNDLLHIPEALFCVTRYDRKKLQGDHVRRLHQIDLCQVLNLPVDMKYQHAYAFSPQGATYADLFRAADSTNHPARSRLDIIRWIIFNYLIGNTDAHAKNVSFFLDHAGLRLAPFYDLVSGTIYGLKDMAFFIGEEEEIQLVGSNDWTLLCRNCGINPALVVSELQAQATKWKKSGRSLIDLPDYLDSERDFLQGLASGIDARADLMMRHAKEMRR